MWASIRLTIQNMKHILREACAIFDIHSMTLRRWLKAANIVPLIDPADQRRRYLTDEQLCLLALAHHRILILPSLALPSEESR